MLEAISTPNLIALPDTSQELGRGLFCTQPKKVVSDSQTTIRLSKYRFSKGTKGTNS